MSAPSRSKPVVGISCYGRAKIPDRYSVPIDYVKAVQRAGADAVLLPPGAPSVLDAVDALVLAGGGDVDPKRYGGGPHPKLYGLDDERDEFEFAILAEALARRMPFLAICRGLQVLNCLKGGTLHPHLEDLPGRGKHRAEIGQSVAHHVELTRGSRVAEALGTTRCEIRSSHHQAVDRAGDGLAIVGLAEDGTVEALELAGHPDALAVQWHPEESAASDPIQQHLFDWVVARAKAAR